MRRLGEVLGAPVELAVTACGVVEHDVEVLAGDAIGLRQEPGRLAGAVALAPELTHAVARQLLGGDASPAAERAAVGFVLAALLDAVPLRVDLAPAPTAAALRARWWRAELAVSTLGVAGLPVTLTIDVEAVRGLPPALTGWRDEVMLAGPVVLARSWLPAASAAALAVGDAITVERCGELCVGLAGPAAPDHAEPLVPVAVVAGDDDGACSIVVAGRWLGMGVLVEVDGEPAVRLTAIGP